MSKTFLNFLDENKHLTDLRTRLYTNYSNARDQGRQHENDLEVNEFQAFFNLSLNLSKQTESIESTFLSSPFDLHSNAHPHPNDILFDEDFLNVGLHDLISQTPPMDYSHDFPDTPIPSVRTHPIDNEDFQSTIEQLFAMSHEPVVTIPSPVQPPMVQMITDSTSKPSFTKCIVVTQDFLQSMYRQDQYQHQQASGTVPNHHSNSIQRPKRRRRRLKVGKENSHQQRKIMPRTTSPEH